MNDPQFQTACCRHCNGTGKGFDHKAYGKFMAANRRAAGLKLRELAITSRMSVGYLCDLEKGRRDWNQSITDKYLRGILTAIKESE